MVERPKKIYRRFPGVTIFMEGAVRFVNLKIVNDDRTLTSTNSHVTVMPILAGRSYVIIAFCTDNALNYRVSHIKCNTARHERGRAACPLREQGKATLRRLAAVNTR
jgi:hypothetical protein